MTERVESICFDLDDTLYAYRRYARAGLAAAADRLEAATGERYLAELREIYFDEERTEGTFDLLVEREGLDPALIDELVEAFHDATTPLTPYPETEAVLARLTGAYALGLITDGRGGREKLRRLGIRDQFDSVLVTPAVGSSKHDPTVFERVLSDLSVEPERAVYVGDDPRVDFAAPNELGMTTVRLRRGRYRGLDPATDAATPDHEIRDLEELPSTVTTTVPPEGPERHRGTDGG